MAGTKVTLDTSDFDRKFKALRERADDITPMLRDAGEILINNTQDRIKSGVDITGKKFAPLADLTISLKRKNKDKVLVESGDLYRELTYQLVKGGLEFGSDRKYAALHQYGGTIKPKSKKILAFKGVFAKQVTIPARPFIGLTPIDQRDILEMLVDHIEGAFG